LSCETQEAHLAAFLPMMNMGSRMAASIAMMAMTTNNSINVNPARFRARLEFPKNSSC
jgi:beta-glucosidase-like glycosyl hydrolase